MPLPNRPLLSSFVLCVVFLSLSTVSSGVERKAKPTKWRDLFDGKSLSGWEKTNYGGEGEVEVQDGKLMLNFGYSMTGVTYQGKDLPRTNYEIQTTILKVDGNDFFCAATFPVADSYCSFIVGGWGGAVTGLSSIDGQDASENETTGYQNFPAGKWYKIKIRVEPHLIQCWINGKQVVYQNILDRKITTRNEVNLNKPLGFATWETKAAYKTIQIRELKTK
ncbi:MAG: hypothetical protein CMJ82_02725 [Planctomycetaceae bacterium]|nr:hypothetical protein [Planctomycetaceae bacterium]|tara:strand:- start:343 stop:1005 length:663 start_codon:yes stop_codon:yes gene_type:complete